MSKLPIDFRDVVRLILLPLSVMAVLTIGVGLLITKVLEPTTIGANDRGVNEELARERTTFWSDVTDVLSGLSDTPVIVGATAVLLIVFRLVFKRWNESLFQIGR